MVCVPMLMGSSGLTSFCADTRSAAIVPPLFSVIFDMRTTQISTTMRSPLFSPESRKVPSIFSLIVPAFTSVEL